MPPNQSHGRHAVRGPRRTAGAGATSRVSLLAGKLPARRKPPIPSESISCRALPISSGSAAHTRHSPPPADALRDRVTGGLCSASRSRISLFFPPSAGSGVRRSACFVVRHPLPAPNTPVMPICLPGLPAEPSQAPAQPAKQSQRSLSLVRNAPPCPPTRSARGAPQSSSRIMDSSPGGPPAAG
ncbi:hypothetical protein PCL_09782 [Purpureocillium lilacinum]|uniref:Uncharacterized protein n=1 Tax=Purpureocillium lilacinum TaxID=33203 RepID=A0A2U3EE21_PURLI|nr:hypothetical protein PCL_09782 [Purpureocillium lilacinum]